MAGLVLGPLLRWVDREAATVWVEVDRSCRVEVLGHASDSFEVAGHHYALVVVDLTERDEVTPYEVHLDDQPVWPLADDPRPAPVIRKPATGGGAAAAALAVALGVGVRTASAGRRARPPAAAVRSGGRSRRGGPRTR